MKYIIIRPLLGLKIESATSKYQLNLIKICMVHFLCIENQLQTSDLIIFQKKNNPYIRTRLMYILLKKIIAEFDHLIK